MVLHAKNMFFALQSITHAQCVWRFFRVWAPRVPVCSPLTHNQCQQNWKIISRGIIEVRICRDQRQKFSTQHNTLHSNSISFICLSVSCVTLIGLHIIWMWFALEHTQVPEGKTNSNQHQQADNRSRIERNSEYKRNERKKIILNFWRANRSTVHSREFNFSLT